MGLVLVVEMGRELLNGALRRGCYGEGSSFCSLDAVSILRLRCLSWLRAFLPAVIQPLGTAVIGMVLERGLVLCRISPSWGHVGLPGALCVPRSDGSRRLCPPSVQGGAVP